MLDEYIEAFQIMRKYTNDYLHGEHDVIYSPLTKEHNVSEEDIKKLDELGWFLDEDTEYFIHYT